MSKVHLKPVVNVRSRAHLYHSTIPSNSFTRFLAALYFPPRILGGFYGTSATYEDLLWADEQLPNHLGFALEFHLAYYALRQYDSRIQDPQGLRRCRKFIFSRPASSLPESLHEAQVSVVIVGVDEWVWTAYCCTETTSEAKRLFNSTKKEASMPLQATQDQLTILSGIQENTSCSYSHCE